MEVDNAVIDCCGIWGLFVLPGTKDEFINRIKYDLVGELYEEYSDAEDKCPNFTEFKSQINCAMIVVSTAHTQEDEEKYLKELGFKALLTNRNENSGNTVTLWGMKREKFLSLIRPYYREWSKEFKEDYE